MYRVCGYQLGVEGHDALNPATSYAMSFTDAMAFQIKLHRMVSQYVSWIEAYSDDHDPAGWCKVSNTTRG